MQPDGTVAGALGGDAVHDCMHVVPALCRQHASSLGEIMNAPELACAQEANGVRRNMARCFIWRDRRKQQGSKPLIATGHVSKAHQKGRTQGQHLGGQALSVLCTHAPLSPPGALPWCLGPSGPPPAPGLHTPGGAVLTTCFSGSCCMEIARMPRKGAGSTGVTLP